MPTRLTDTQHTALVRRAIANAQTNATSDEEFVRLLRATYFTTHPVLRTIVASRGSSRSRTAAPTADPSFRQLLGDPRFLKNARALAGMTQRRLRIIGGTTVTGNPFPDCVAVGSLAQWACSGTLIAPTVVVTACHCADVAQRVWFGNSVHGRGVMIKVKQRFRHPGYVPERRNDLLVLILEKPASAKPRRLAPTKLIDKAKYGRAVGFGNVDANGQFGYGTKRQVDVPIGSTRCAGKVGGKSDAAVYQCAKNLELVAGKPLLAMDSCAGDSGGPFYVPDGRGGWLLAGATSRATPGALHACGDGGIYERVDQYRAWIEKAAGVKLP